MRNRLSEALKTAMKEKDTKRLSTLRLINAAIKDRDIAARGEGEEGLVSDEVVLAILGKRVKQRKESARAWPASRADGSPPVVVRKGRENYLCLLNLEDALQGGFAGRPAILAHLVARWAA